MSIKREQNHFAPVDRCAKLFTGLTDPIAGPIFPRLDAALLEQRQNRVLAALELQMR